MRKESWFFLFFPVSQILALAGYYMTAGSLHMGHYLGMALGLAADGILLWVLLRGNEKESLEKELEELHYLRETERLHNEAIEERRKKVLEMQEEFNEKLRVISEKLEAGQVEDVGKDMQQLQEELAGTHMHTYCQNTVINAVLNEKQKVCENLGFRMDIDLLITQKLTMNPLHVCSVFSNLVDNAIEAVSEIERKARFIEVSADRKGAYLFIKVKNPAKKEHVMRKKREGHGYGTQILENIAKRYEGEYASYYGEDACYSAVLVLKAFDVEKDM